MEQTTAARTESACARGRRLFLPCPLRCPLPCLWGVRSVAMIVVQGKLLLSLMSLLQRHTTTKTALTTLALYNFGNLAASERIPSGHQHSHCWYFKGRKPVLCLFRVRISYICDSQGSWEHEINRRKVLRCDAMRCVCAKGKKSTPLFVAAAG